MSTQIPGLYIAHTPLRGRGVFSARAVTAGDTIELCPVIVLPPADLPLIHRSALHDYYFLWGEGRDRAAIALGFGSLYNHSSRPNAEIDMDLEMELIAIRCIRDILPGEEVTIDYQPDPDFEDRLWFEEL
jgi:SET domain-containing protein